MGFFLKALAAIVTADAIDRHARGRRTKYWYPDRPGPPPPGGRLPYASVGGEPPGRRRATGNWDPQRPERP